MNTQFKDQTSSAPETQKESNLAPSAIFVKKNVLSKFYPEADQKGLIKEGNRIINSNEDPNGEDVIEFKIAVRDLTDKNIEFIDGQPLDEESKQKAKNAWNNFAAGLVKNVKPREQ